MVTYQQPVKNKTRRAALTRAVNLLTSGRQKCALVPEDYVDRVRVALSHKDRHALDQLAAAAVRQEDIASWRSFWQSNVGSRSASQLTVAYLAGPEPTNDLKVLIELGVRPENIWAFEIDSGVFESALADVQNSELRGVKLMNVSIDDYFIAAPHRFDLIYFDACGPLPSYDQKTTLTLSNIFRHSALSPLSVLVTNFSLPDISKPEVLDNFSHLVASYLYPKSFLDTFNNPSHTFTDGAESQCFVCAPYSSMGPEDCGSFVDEVKKDFENYYGSFITRQVNDLASVIAPSVRLFNSNLAKSLFPDIQSAVKYGEQLISPLPDYTDGDEGVSDNEFDIGSETFSAEEALDVLASQVDESHLGGAFFAPSMSSILHAFASCGLPEGNKSHGPIPMTIRKFCGRWANHLSGSPEPRFKAVATVAAFYALREGKFWSSSLSRVAAFDYRKEMPMLCDVPTDELAFYPTFAQLAFPAHLNIAQTRRYRYVADGKQTQMYLDVLPFDECRWVYDWLSAAPLIDGDWQDMSRQLVFRFALDGIAKNNRWYQDDYLFGCHVVGTNEPGFDGAELTLRRQIGAGADKPASSMGSGDGA